MKKGITQDTIIRTIVLFVALLNQMLVMAGKNPLPFLDDDLADILSYVFTLGASLVAWWKNNSFTREAIQADEYLNVLKEEGAADEKRD